MIDIETVAVSEFYPEIRMECSGVPEFEMDRVIPRAAIDLLRTSRLWRETVEDHPVYPGGEAIAVNDLIASDAAVALDVAGVFLSDNEDRRLHRYSYNPLNRDLVRLRGQTCTEFTGYVVNAAKTVTMVPDLEEDADPVNVDLELILIPTQSATTLPEFLLTDYVEIIAAGAKARLMIIKDAPWFDMKLADYFRRMFWAGVAEAGRLSAKYDIDARNDNTRRRR